MDKKACADFTDSEKASRAATCVNALEGIANPAAVPEVVEALKTWVSEIETHRRIQYSPQWERDSYNRARESLRKLDAADEP
jgi:hypothetical protein